MNQKYTLKKNHEIENLIHRHQSVGNKFYIVYYEDSLSTKIAISISKKLGKAYFRNYQKRVLREIIRKNFKMITNKNILIVIKVKSIELSYQEKEKEIKNLLNKMRLKA